MQQTTNEEAYGRGLTVTDDERLARYTGGTNEGIPTLFRQFEKDFTSLALLGRPDTTDLTTIDETRAIKQAVEKFYVELQDISTVYFKGTEIEVVLNVFLNLWNLVVHIVHDNIKILTRESEVDLHFQKFKIAANTDIAELKFKLDQLTTQIDSRETKFTAVQDFLKRRVATLQNLFDSLVNSGGITLRINAQLDNEIEKIRRKFEQHTTDLMNVFRDTMDKEITETREAYSTYITSFVEEIHRLVDIDQLDSDIVEWKSKFEVLVEEHARTTITIKEDEITRLRTEKASLEAEIAELRRAKETIEMEKRETEHLFMEHHDALHDAADELRKFKDLFNRTDDTDDATTGGYDSSKTVALKGAKGAKGATGAKGAKGSPVVGTKVAPKYAAKM